MKSIKLLLIGILFFATSNIIAQEKQNDATWEETISFLKENISVFSGTKYYSLLRDGREDRNTSNDYEVFINNSREIEAILKSFHRWSRKANLDYLLRPERKITEDGEEKFILHFIQNKVDDSYTDPGTIDNSKKSSIEINVYRRQTIKYDKNGDDKFISGVLMFNENSELPSRIFKAFQHLAYLAKEKRKESKF